MSSYEKARLETITPVLFAVHITVPFSNIILTSLAFILEKNMSGLLYHECSVVVSFFLALYGRMKHTITTFCDISSLTQARPMMLCIYTSYHDYRVTYNSNFMQLFSKSASIWSYCCKQSYFVVLYIIVPWRRLTTKLSQTYAMNIVFDWYTIYKSVIEVMTVVGLHMHTDMTL